jgi:hypothetical protein
MNEAMEHDQIEELLELTRDNNRMLKSMRRAQIWSGVFRFIYWALILGSLAGTYYYLQPLMERYMGTMQTMLGNSEQLGSGSKLDLNSLKSLISSQVGK